MYSIFVYGMDLENAESEGGWQRYYVSSEFKQAQQEAKLLAKDHSEDDICLIEGPSLDDGFEVNMWTGEYVDTSDDYYAQMDMHCDKYGMCGGYSCPNYFKCQC